MIRATNFLNPANPLILKILLLTNLPSHWKVA